MKRHPDWSTDRRFTCAACEQEAFAIGASLRQVGMPESLSLAICKPCHKRMNRDRTFRKRVCERAAFHAWRAFTQRLADVLKIDWEDLNFALGKVGKSGASPEILDRVFGFAPGQFVAAVAFVVRSA